jgi:acetylornithine deacetylase/succinyl-diaminopimelate desuccinylase-like protein
VAQVAKDPLWNSMMRTTCVPTMVTAGHAQNALPQRATANVNCRILPGESVEATQQKLIELAGDKDIAITLDAKPTPQSPAPVIGGAVTEPARAIAAKIWPGVPLVPTLSTGATDGIYSNAAGIPTYGMSGMFREPDGNGIHGLNERIRVKSLSDGRQFLHEVVKLYGAGG